MVESTDASGGHSAMPVSVESSFSGAVSQPWWWMVAAVVTVGSLTLGQTLLSIIGNSPEFFIAQRLSTVGIIGTAVFVVLSPVVLAIPILILRLFAPPVAAIWLAMTLGVLVGVFTVYTLDRFGQSSGIAIAGGILAGLLMSSAHLFTNSMRTFIRYLSPVPIVVLLTFAFMSPTSGLIMSDERSGAELTGSAADIPVVVMVFDGLPLATIMDGSGTLISDAFPGFAKIANDGTWYRNAVTNAIQTKFAVPTIMTGISPDATLQPTSVHHPDSVFTALSNTHDVEVVEPLTRMCDIAECRDEAPSGMAKALSVLSDLWLVGQHIVLPESLSESLAPIDQTWGNFDSEAFRQAFGDQAKGDRREGFNEFRARFGESRTQPPLLFGHFLLPHPHWEFLEDGTRIPRGNLPDFVEASNPWIGALNFQRYLHVARYVDQELLTTLRELERENLYDDSLVVVVADHGREFVVGQGGRTLKPEVRSGVVSIPLFVKYPQGMEEAPVSGSVDDFRAETVDIVPTIMNVLGATSPYDLDGQSLLDIDGRKERKETRTISKNGEIRYPMSLEPVMGVGERFDRIVPSRDPRELTPPGVDPTLFGQKLDVRDLPELSIRDRRGTDPYKTIDLGDEPFPATFSAIVRGGSVGDTAVVLVDGHIVTLTEVYTNPDGQTVASGMIPKQGLHAGNNNVEIALLSDDGSLIK